MDTTPASGAFGPLREIFDAPPRTFGPTPLWWWSGAEVTRERLEWQMRTFAAGGITNLVVINLAPAGPIYSAQADEPAWFSDVWWQRFDEACEIASELDMKLWFYDQVGFSGANVQGSITYGAPSARGSALRGRHTAVAGGRVALRGDETPLALYDGAGARLTLAPDGGTDADDDTPVLLVSTVPTSFDYLDVDAVALLMDTIHGEFERRVGRWFGSVIAGSFQDELPATNSWTAGFAEEFATRRGYDLLDHLPALFQTGDDEAAKVRGDYFAVRSELAERALFRPLGEWHSQRGMLIGSDQSNPARAGYPTQATQIYTDYFRTHRWYGAAGSDHEGDAKVHSSMAHLYGHERVWIEAFHSSGWGGTLEDTYDWLLPFLRSGANLYNPHASYFGTAGGWFEWAPPSTDWRQPYWRHYPRFSDTVARIGSLMSWGTFSADVALLHPTATAQALVTLDAPIDHFGEGRLGEGFEGLDETQECYLALSGVNNWFTTRPGALDGAGIAYDVVDDDSVQRATTRDGRLSVAGLSYGTVLLPSSEVLEEGTARRLVELLDAGGRVVSVGRPPRIAAGRDGDDAAVQSLVEHPRFEHVTGVTDAVETVGADAGYARSDVPLLVRRDGDLAAALVTGAFPRATAYPLRTQGGPWRWEDYDFDPARYAPTRTVHVRGPVAEAEAWNPATGTTTTATITRDRTGSTIEVPLDGAPAVIVVWREGEPSPQAESAEQASTLADPARTTDLGEGWRGTLVPTLENRWGDFALPAGSDVGEVQIWSFDAAGAGAEWAPVTAGYGERVRVHPPRPLAELPAPLTAEQSRAVLAGSMPLAGEPWTVQRHSPTRGLENPIDGALGLKALVPEEFVVVDSPAAGSAARIRTILRAPSHGDADLVVGSGSAKTVYWDGVRLPTGDGYLAVAPVRADGEAHVLEIELGADENQQGMAMDGRTPTLGAFFALTERDGFGSRPVFMQLPPGVEPDGSVRYRAGFEVADPTTSITLVVGAATGLTVLLDGERVARQEKVEYYEGAWGATPMFFRHDLGSAAAGGHVLEIVTESFDARDVLFVDLAAQSPDGTRVLVSGAGWEVRTGEVDTLSIARRGGWGESAAQRAVPRPHPLPGAAWLSGDPVDGRAALPIHATDDPRSTPQRFRLRLPAGTRRVELPLRAAATATVAGRPVAIADGAIVLPEVLDAPGDLVIETEPSEWHGAAAWTGPARVRTETAPLALGDWATRGLSGWSGAVRYERELDLSHVDGQRPVVLDLGRVRGSVTLEVDGVEVGEAFCSPYRFELFAAGEAPAGCTVAVTVHNNLGPFMAETTPTRWVFPAQRVSGILGPVVLRN